MTQDAGWREMHILENNIAIVYKSKILLVEHGSQIRKCKTSWSTMLEKFKSFSERGTKNPVQSKT